ncbi:MAG: B12-binding domain-containing protein [Anaerolineae bacterium]|jgi:methylmalonyl-CoA mutase cobalamin-binding domain/chain
MGETKQPGDALRLSQALADLQEDEALEIVRQRMGRGDDPLKIIEDCQAGMREVGEQYTQQRYFLAALIMAGEILREIMEIVLPAVESRYTGKSSGRILVGTVQGDIHDLGKNILLMLLRSYGFSVMDLGVDVAPDGFVEGAREFKPHVIGLSGLITAAHVSMRETVGALRTMMAEDGTDIPILLGGQVDEQVCSYVGADYWTTDAMEGVRLCQRLVAEA